MQIRLGEHVLTSDGQDAGPIDKVVLDPDSGTVTSVLLREGFILRHDVQVTLDRLREDASGRLRLALPADRLDELPRFDESLFKTPPADIVLPTDYPQETILLPTGWIDATTTPNPAPAPIAGDPEAREEVLSRLYAQDLENAVVKAGSAIKSRDGEKIGELERLAFDQDGRLAGLVVRRGFLFPKELELPGSLVESAGDGVLYLTVDRARFAELAR
jgi:sporulation protein YlmC with PRC-barrel domain